MKIQNITGNEELITQIIDTSEPEGLFIAKQNDVYVAIDSTGADVEINDFSSLKEAQACLEDRYGLTEETEIIEAELVEPKNMQLTPITGLVITEPQSDDGNTKGNGEPTFNSQGKRGLPGFMGKFENIVQFLQDNEFIFVAENTLRFGNYAVEIIEIRTSSSEAGELDDPAFDLLDYQGIIHAVNEKVGNQIWHFRPTDICDLLSKLMLVMNKMRISFKQTQELGVMPKASAVVKLSDDTMILKQFSHGLKTTLFTEGEY